MIKDIGLSKALVPRFPGVTSALGCVIADMRFDWVHTLNVSLDDLDLDQLDREMVKTAKDGELRLLAANVLFEGIEHRFALDMLYLGQTHTVSVSLPLKILNDETGVNRDLIEAAFKETYHSAFGRSLDGIAVRILNLRVAVIGLRPKFDLSVLGPPTTGKLEVARIENREIWIDGKRQQAEGYRRLDLPRGTVVPGPALLEQPDTTIYVDPDLEGTVDRFGNFMISRKDRP